MNEFLQRWQQFGWPERVRRGTTLALVVTIAKALSVANILVLGVGT